MVSYDLQLQLEALEIQLLSNEERIKSLSLELKSNGKRRDVAVKEMKLIEQRNRVLKSELGLRGPGQYLLRLYKDEKYSELLKDFSKEYENQYCPESLNMIPPKRPLGDIIIQKFNMNISVHDMNTLKNKNLLNDQVK